MSALVLTFLLAAADPPPPLPPPPVKGGQDQAVPCSKCRMPVVVRKEADGTRKRYNLDGTPHVH
jgi:hypothetical protein